MSLILTLFCAFLLLVIFSLSAVSSKDAFYYEQEMLRQRRGDEAIMQVLAMEVARLEREKQARLDKQKRPY